MVVQIATIVFRAMDWQIAANMVAATLDIYNTIADNLLPTPAKSHYTFNLRDLSKVFQVRGPPFVLRKYVSYHLFFLT